MIYLAKVFWEDNVGKITGVRELPDSEIYNADKFKVINENLYDYLKTNYELGDLSFPDTVVELTQDVITFEPFDEMVAFVNNALNSFIRKEVRNEDDLGLDLFLISIKFTILNNQFLEKGFYFSPDNKEEIYLGVLNSGDMHLIEILEDYIETLDAVTSYNTKVNEYIAMKKEFLTAETVQEIKDIYASYTARNLIDDMNN